MKYSTLFLDIGGVILTNGWDHHMREKASRKFSLDLGEINKRHSLMFDTYEIGKMSLKTYLDYVIFFEERSFTQEEFREFMFSQSQAIPEMIALIQDCKKRFSLTIIAVSNEGRELMDHRIQNFKLKEFIDFFICSCFTGLRKPDEGIYRMALDAAQVCPKEVIYIDDRQILTQIGRKLGMQTITHVSFEETQKELNAHLNEK